MIPSASRAETRLRAMLPDPSPRTLNTSKTRHSRFLTSSCSSVHPGSSTPGLRAWQISDSIYGQGMRPTGAVACLGLRASGLEVPLVQDSHHLPKSDEMENFGLHLEP